MIFPQPNGFRRRRFLFLLVASLLVASTKPGFAQVKASIPTTAQQKEKVKVLEEIYKLNRLETAAKKQEIVKELAKHSRDQNLPPDERYVVLTTLISLTKETGDFTSWLNAVNQLIGAFDVDARKEKQRLLVDFLGASKSGTTLKPAAVEEALAMVRLAAQENQYADATPLLNSIEAAVRRPPAAIGLLKAVAEARDTIATREKDWNAFQAASKKLANHASDPTANFTVGRWHLLYQSDWNAALPFLAKVSDASWKAAAERELSSPLDAVAQADIGDAWWKIGQTETGDSKTAVLLHSKEWYARALPNLPSSLKKQAVIKRLAELAELKGGKTAVANKVASNMPAVTTSPIVPQSWQTVEAGKSVDLLASVKLPDHVIHGRWQRKSNELALEPTSGSLAFAPVAIQGNYTLDVEFTRRSGERFVFVGLPIAFSGCHLILSNGGGVTHGLNYLDGQNTWKHPASGAVFRPGVLQNGHRYKLHIEVVNQVDRTAVAASLDGQWIIRWIGKLDQLTVPSEYATPLAPVVSIGGNDVAVDFHVLTLKLNQEAKAYLLGDDFLSPATQITSVPPKAIESKCVRWNGRPYFVSDKPMSITEAQRLAAQLNGRLLTISTPEEEAAVIENGQGLTFWMAGWRCSESNQWKDERNRALRYMGNWAAGEPRRASNERQLAIRTASTRDRGWDDSPPFNYHAVIEWDEEYPKAK